MVGRPTASSRRAETCPKLAVDLLRGYRCRATLLDIAGALLELGPLLLFKVSGAGRLFSEARFESARSSAGSTRSSSSSCHVRAFMP